MNYPVAGHQFQNNKKDTESHFFENLMHKKLVPWYTSGFQ